MQKQIGTYSHILKPFNAYSARYTKGDTDITVNYSLDNYVRIYGKVNGKYDTRSGYLITDDVKISKETNYQINVNDNPILLEALSETISYDDKEAKPYPYVYDSNNTKVYFDGDSPFQITKVKDRYERTDLKDSSVHYKRISFLTINGGKYYNVYQALNASSDGKIEQGAFYKTDNDQSNKLQENKVEDIGFSIELKKDCSAINYYVESYCFSKWVKNELGDIECSNIDADYTSQYGTGKIFNINSDNNPEDKQSTFYEHKKEVIKQSLITNLNQAITSYSRNSKDAGEYKLPVLSESDWDQLVDNVSIITFVQGIPIGLKNYNNYAIATSTRNKEFVNRDSIYLQKHGDNAHHVLGCSELNKDDNTITGYRNIDYDIQKANKNKDQTQYYYAQNSNRENCYYCLVQRALLKEEENQNATIAHTTALARERANQVITQVELKRNYDEIEPIYPDKPEEPDLPVVPDPPPEQEPTITITPYTDKGVITYKKDNHYITSTNGTHANYAYAEIDIEPKNSSYTYTYTISKDDNIISETKIDKINSVIKTKEIKEEGKYKIEVIATKEGNKTITTSITIKIDNTGPKIKEIWRKIEPGAIFNYWYIYAEVEDEVSELKEVRIKFDIIWKIMKNITGTNHYKAKASGIFDAIDGTIIVTDIFENKTTVKYHFSAGNNNIADITIEEN